MISLLVVICEMLCVSVLFPLCVVLLIFWLDDRRLWYLIEVYCPRLVVDRGVSQMDAMALRRYRIPILLDDGFGT